MALTNRLFSEAFRDMQRAFSVFDQPGFFDLARRSPMASNGGRWDSFARYPATDMVETPQSFELQAEVPGYEKKDIQIELADSRTLVLRGSFEHKESSSNDPQKVQESSDTQMTEGSSETAISKEVNPPQWWTNERSVGSFHRSFSFPVPIQAEGIKASYENGILKIIIPKSKEDDRKTIQID